jgi:ureidoglycolate dehydrogenase (NAD+)
MESPAFETRSRRKQTPQAITAHLSAQPLPSPTMNPPPPPNRCIPIAPFQEWVAHSLQRVGVPLAESEGVAEALVRTDAMGISTHGTKLLVGYLKKLKSGGYRPTASPSILREGVAWGVIDGDHGLGQVGCRHGLQVARNKAKVSGIAQVHLIHTGHLGAPGFFAAQAAREGFIAMILGNDIPSVAAPGACRAVLGSNPLAYAIPRIDDDPILLDIATAAVAGGKVYAARQRGEPIPEHWLIGPDGQPTSDASLYPQSASLAPMAGHKGFGLGLWCEVLAGVLPGGSFTWQIGSWLFDPPEQPSSHNASIFLLDVSAITDRQQFDRRLKQLVEEITNTPVGLGASPLQVPGQREWTKMRHAESDGIPLPDDVLAKIAEAADLVNLPLPDTFSI